MTVGYVGRLEPHKGVSTLLDAAATAPDWVLEIVGGGPLELSFVRQAEQLGSVIASISLAMSVPGCRSSIGSSM